MKKTVQFLAAALAWFSAHTAVAQTTVSVDANANWIGYANVFDLSNNYMFGSQWVLADLKTVVNTTDQTLTLYPNYNTYNAADPYWANGAIGNKIFEANTFVENAALAGQTLTFTGHVNSNTLNSAYQNIAFIKALNPNTGYSTDVYVTSDLVAGQNFTVTAQNIPAGLIVQYGFMVKGLNANPADMAALGNVVVTAPSIAPPPSNIVEVDANANWLGYMNVFDTSNNYMFGSAWALEDVKTLLDTGANTVTLYPNYNTYNASDAYWANGAIGNKIMEANSFVENPALAGQSLTFRGFVSSNTLNNEYQSVAFIKGLNPNTGYSMDIYQTAALVQGQNFEVHADNIPAGLIVQYGFLVKGLNANPAQMSALGNVVVGAYQLDRPQFNAHTVRLFPNPAHDYLQLQSPDSMVRVRVLGLQGQVLRQWQPQTSEFIAEIADLTAGMYVIEAQTAQGVQSIKWIKN